jgi:hypothetical protein
VVARPCEVRWELDFSMGFVCLAPLRLEGLRGEQSTPSVGWEVLVRYSWLTSGELEGARSQDNNFDVQFTGYDILFFHL